MAGDLVTMTAANYARLANQASAGRAEIRKTAQKLVRALSTLSPEAADRVTRALPRDLTSAIAKTGKLKPHAMFPTAKVARAHIAEIRLNRTDPAGRYEWCPMRWRSEDLRTWSQVRNLYGGGEYRAIGLDDDGCVVAVFPERNDEYVKVKGARKSLCALGLPDTRASR